MAATVRMLSPEGEKWDLDVVEAREAVKHGWKLENAPSQASAAVRGLGQGGTLGWSDELVGGLKALQRYPADVAYAAMHPESGFKERPLGEHYVEARGEERAANEAAQLAHPTTYGAAEAGGTVLADIAAATATGGAALPWLAAGQGALQGAGYSDADLARGQWARLAGDTSLGAGLGLAGYGIGAAGSKAASRLLSKAGGKLSAAEAKAAANVAKREGERVASASGSYGQKVADQFRQVERLLILEKEGDQGAKATLAAIRNSPDWQDAISLATKSVSEKLPAAASATRAAKSELDQLLSTQVQRTAEELAKERSSSVVQSGKELFKSYGEPVLGAALGSAVGSQFDSPGTGAALGTAGGLVFGRTRAGKALMSRIEKPGNQIAIWSLVKGGAQAVPQQLGRYTDVLRRAAMRGDDALAATHFLLYSNDQDYRQGLDEHAKQLQSGGE